MENYKEKYEEALERARVWKEKSGMPVDRQGILDDIFPELKESQDEKIRKMLVEQMVRWHKCALENNVIQDIKDSAYAIAWLEKQDKQKCPSLSEKEIVCLKRALDFLREEHNSYTGKDFTNEIAVLEWLIIHPVLIHPSELQQNQGEQKPADKVEPKFKVGDWILIDNPCKIISIDGNYIVQYCDDEKTREISKKFCESQFHLWSIQDAKDGDVLSTNNDGICIFDGTVEDGIYPFAYCGLTRYGFESYDRKLPFTHDNNVYPATKKQYNLLFQKMKESGYEWDAEKKELKKIEQKPAWNEEDSLMIDKVESWLDTLCDYLKDSSSDCISEVRTVIDMLKTLKNRVQPQQEWSEEDEKYFRSSRCYLNEFGNWLSSKNEEKSLLVYKACDWLKSLKERYTWKPSESDILLLERIANGKSNPQDFQASLGGLIGQLKKLMEE